ncbi:hypothetical protein HDA40_000662 [Hamadaea flava]|uniref:Uncharacterized protein n=1 Tax=Hamadaea flava TaxID=1742688 RepID=A0ABV8M0Q9_9ACTN|nr:hypothetical protein [Hamadaea flava]MCP2322155.1 hypothetical protein [Hamadaea flava]
MTKRIWYPAAALAAVVASLLLAAPANAATAIEYGLIAALIAVPLT